jgi:hypothetical protein
MLHCSECLFPRIVEHNSGVNKSLRDKMKMTVDA